MLGSTLDRLLDCAVWLEDGRRFAQASLELMAVPRCRVSVDAKEKAAQIQADLWAVLDLPAIPGHVHTPTLSASKMEQLRAAGLTDSSEPFHVSTAKCKLFDCVVSFQAPEAFASQEFEFSLQITLNAPVSLRFQRLSAAFSGAAFVVELADGVGAPAEGGNSTALERSEQVTHAYSVIACTVRRFQWAHAVIAARGASWCLSRR